jgi:hypothetical protein
MGEMFQIPLRQRYFPRWKPVSTFHAFAATLSLFQIFENDFCKSWKINKAKAEPEGLPPRRRGLSVFRLRVLISVADATRPNLGSNPKSFCRFATGSAGAEPEGFESSVNLRLYA